MKGYKVETVEKYRAVIKKFYKMVYGNNEYYPNCVKWFSVKVGKDNIAEYLEEEEIPTHRKYANITEKSFFGLFI